MFKITNTFVRRLFNSYGLPTIEVIIEINSSYSGKFIVPSGTSVGKNEAKEVIDNNFDVSSVIKNLKEILFPQILNTVFSSPEEFDEFLCKLDGTKDKSFLGANAIIACSVAFWNAVASANQTSLCRYLAKDNLSINQSIYPFINLINGGKHGFGGLSIQEFMIVPQVDTSFDDKMMIACEVNQALRALAKKYNFSLNVGKEGGISLDINDTKQALDLLLTAIGNKDVLISMDAAADSFYFDGKYHIDDKKLDFDQMINFYVDLVNSYPIFSIEDPLSEDFPEEWGFLKSSLVGKALIVGDDLTVTNANLIKNYSKYIDCVIIKPNQIGTISETILAVKTAHELGLKTIFSHRSNDTEDVTISHLALGLNSYGIKFGGMSRSERLAKYNEVIRILD